MFGFNVNQPLNDPRMIAATIGGYETPEAAETDFRDNAPQGMQYLTDQYQRLTGNAFADPFEDAKNQRSEAMIRAAMGGASVATGSNTGMRLLGMPDVSSIPPTPASRPVTTLQQPTNSPPVASALLQTPAGNSNVDVRNETLRNMLTNKGQLYRLNEKDMQIPDVIDDNFYSTLQKRANLLGVGSEFNKIPAQALTASTNDDPRFDKTQAGKAVGMDIHPIAYDDNFQELARREPEKANALYHAVTNRDYDTDLNAKRQQLTEQRGDRRKLIEGIKGLEADPVTGELYALKDVKDTLGRVMQQPMPLTPLEKAAIDAEGGTKRLYGVDLPGRGGLQKLPGMTDAELVDYRSKTQQLMKEKGLNVNAASALAHRMMYQEQQNKTAPALLTAQRPALNRTLSALADMQISGANTIPKLLNFFLSRGAYTDEPQAPVPLIPHPDWANLERNDVPLSDILRESVNNLRGLPAGRGWNNQPLATR